MKRHPIDPVAVLGVGFVAVCLLLWAAWSFAWSQDALTLAFPVGIVVIGVLGLAATLWSSRRDDRPPEDDASEAAPATMSDTNDTLFLDDLSTTTEEGEDAR